MNRRIAVATWNIGAGILGESHQENGVVALDYHASLVREQDPDIVCFQEAHDFEGFEESQTNYLARQLGYPYSISIPISPSHLGDNASLALGIASRFPIKDTVYRTFDNPGLTATGPNGNSWVLFDKGYLICTVVADGEDIGIVNVHCFPLHYFGARPAEPRFKAMWDQLCADLTARRGLGRTVVAIDLNHEPIEELLSAVLACDLFLNAFARTPTIPKGIQQDYILYDTRLRLMSTTVRPTLSDHYYCQIDLSL
jgi:endonuclease/exonuclease/phosphatase family metal-dependent hydrolase